MFLHSLNVTQLNKPNFSCLTSSKGFTAIYAKKKDRSKGKNTKSQNHTINVSKF